MSGVTVIDTNAGMVHWASSWSTHLVRQETKGYGVLRLAGADSLAENLNVDGMNDTLDFTGVTIGGTGQFRHACGVRIDPTGHRSTIRNLRGKGFMYAACVASVTPEAMTAGTAMGDRVKDAVVDGVFSDGCWTALQSVAVQGMRVRNLTGTYQDVTGSGGEAHIIYLAGYNSEYSFDVSIDDCRCWGGKQHGTADYAGAYKFSQVKGLTMSNLRAQDCPGLISVEKCSDIDVGSGIIGVRDTTVGAAPMVQFMDCAGGSVAPIIAKSSAQLTNGSVSARILRCTNIDFDSPRVTVAPPVAPGTAYILTISGDCSGSRVRRPELVNDGVGAVNFGLMIDAGGNTSSNIEIDDPRIAGNVQTGVRMNLKDATVKYRSARIAVTTRRVQIDSTATPSKLINLDNVSRIDTHPRVLGWHYGEQPSSADAVAVWPSGQPKLYAFGNDWAGNWNGRISAGNNGRRVFAATFVADVDISVDVRLGGTRAGICLRAVSDSTYLAVSRAAGAVKIHKVVAGTATELATVAVTVPDAAFAALRAVIVGAAIQVLLNGVAVLPHVLSGGDETTFVSAGHGLYGELPGTSAWENVRVSRCRLTLGQRCVPCPGTARATTL